MSNELEEFVGKDESETDTTVEMTAESQAAEEVTNEQEVINEAAQPDTQDKGEEGEPPSPTDKPQETMVPLAAKQAEKEKRQQLQQELERTRLELARIQGMQQASQKTEPEQVPDPYTQPEAYTEYVYNQKQKQMSAQQENILRARINAAEEIARTELPEYDKYADYFATEVVKNDPRMRDMMLAAPDPARFAYYKGKAGYEATELQTKVEAAGGLEAYVQQRINEATTQVGKPEPVIPPDLSGVRSVGNDSMADDIPDGTDGLNQLLGR